MKLKNIPNILSVIRIILVAVFVVTFFFISRAGAIVVFLIAGVTDVVDGYLARRNNWITDIGKILDPFADKLMQCTVLVCLYAVDIVPLWFLVPFVAKEVFTLFIGLLVMKKRSVVVVSKWYGKLTVCLFYATIVVSVAFEKYIKGWLALVVFLPAIICAVATLIAYVKHYAGLRHKDAAQIKSKEESEKAASAENI